jgi:hypothetical protein
MSSEERKEKVELPERRSDRVTIEGKEILLPKLSDPQLTRDSRGALYVKHPDGSMRRATPKRSKLSKIKTKRGMIREMAALEHYVRYVRPQLEGGQP